MSGNESTEPLISAAGLLFGQIDALHVGLISTIASLLYMDQRAMLALCSTSVFYMQRRSNETHDMKKS